MQDKKKAKAGRKCMFELYVSGQTPNSFSAINNLKKILAEGFNGTYGLRIIDVMKNPQLAESEKVLATPMLSRVFPLPAKRIIGDLSNREQVLLELSLV